MFWFSYMELLGHKWWHNVISVFLLLVVATVLFFVPAVVFAQSPGAAPVDVRLPNPIGSLIAEPPVDAPTGDGATTGATTIALLIGRGVQILLGLLGVIGFVIVIIGGIILLTSAGDHSKIEKGRGMLVNSVMGTLVVLTSYLLVRFVIQMLQQ